MRNPKASIPDFSRCVTPCGSRLKTVYQANFNGLHTNLVATGVIDIQEQIDSYAPFTDLNYMLHRLSVGDTSVLARRTPVFGDFSNLPDNPIDIINIVHRAEHQFAALPVEEKEKHNNDYRIWLSHVFDTSRNNTDAVRSVTDPSSSPVVSEV